MRGGKTSEGTEEKRIGGKDMSENGKGWKGRGRDGMGQCGVERQVKGRKRKG